MGYNIALATTLCVFVKTSSTSSTEEGPHLTKVSKRGPNVCLAAVRRCAQQVCATVSPRAFCWCLDHRSSRRSRHCTGDCTLFWALYWALYWALLGTQLRHSPRVNDSPARLAPRYCNLDTDFRHLYTTLHPCRAPGRWFPARK